MMTSRKHLNRIVLPRARVSSQSQVIAILVLTKRSAVDSAAPGDELTPYPNAAKLPLVEGGRVVI